MKEIFFSHSRAQLKSILIVMLLVLFTGCSDSDSGSSGDESTYVPTSSSSTDSSDDGYDYNQWAIMYDNVAYESDYDEACSDTFGSTWRGADWSELESFYESGGDMEEWVEEVGLDVVISAWVKRNGAVSYSDTRDYCVSYHNHEKPDSYLAHDNIDDYYLSLGSWYSDRYILSPED